MPITQKLKTTNSTTVSISTENPNILVAAAGGLLNKSCCHFDVLHASLNNVRTTHYLCLLSHYLVNSEKQIMHQPSTFQIKRTMAGVPNQGCKAASYGVRDYSMPSAQPSIQPETTLISKKKVNTDFKIGPHLGPGHIKIF